MKYFAWSEAKNKLLKSERGVSFEMVVEALSNNKILGRFKHPNKMKYPNQKVYILEIGEYAYFVPYVEDKEKIFFKTIYPSRSATKKYLNK